MNIRIGFSVIFALLITVLFFCAVKSFRSKKSIGKFVGLLNLSLIPPMIGNLIIIVSGIREVSLVGYYTYFIGMDLVVLTLVRFTVEYCSGIIRRKKPHILMYAALALDVIQILLNPFFGHAFNIEPVSAFGSPYYQLIPFWGQTVHRIAVYSVFLCVIIILLLAAIRTTRIYRERFSILLIAMLLIGVWQTFYIFSRTPIDRSMIGYGVFGILVFYLSLYYRPLRLLDNMLSNIAADMTEALFVYAPTGKVIWANETGMKLLHLEKDDLEKVSPCLQKLFGSRPYTNRDWSDNRIIGSGDNARYYYIQNCFVSDNKKHLSGSYLIIRDNTEEHRKMQRELYHSTHDALTDL